MHFMFHQDGIPRALIFFYYDYSLDIIRPNSSGCTKMVREQQGLDYIPISPAYPQKENRFILKGWGIKLRVLGWVFYLFYNS